MALTMTRCAAWWRWRDWVVQAFNQNMPYGPFYHRSTGGRLEKSPTLNQGIATGFNRNHGNINSEGGIIDEEYRVSYVNDRVRTTSMAWMGLTHGMAPDVTTTSLIPSPSTTTTNSSLSSTASMKRARMVAWPMRLQLSKLPRTNSSGNRGVAAPNRDRSPKMQDFFGEAEVAQRFKYDRVFRTPVPTNAIPASNQVVCLELRSWIRRSKPSPNAAGGQAIQVEGKITSAPGPLGEPALVFDGQSDLKTQDFAAPLRPGLVFAAWVRRDRAEQAPSFFNRVLYGAGVINDYGKGVQISL